jgi:outer membrane autotransporter protein
MSNSSGLWFYNLVQSNTEYTRALNSSILLADATKPSQTFSSLRNIGSGGEEYDLFFDSVDVEMTFNADNVYFSGKEYAKLSFLQTKFEDTNSIDFVINVDLDPDQVGLQTLVSRDESFTIFLDDGVPVFESTSTRSLITDTENDRIRERKGVFVYNATEAFTGSWLRVRSSWSETGTVVEFFQSDDGVSYSQIGASITSNALDMYFGGSTITLAADTGGFTSLK